MIIIVIFNQIKLNNVKHCINNYEEWVILKWLEDKCFYIYINALIKKHDLNNKNIIYNINKSIIKNHFKKCKSRYLLSDKLKGLKDNCLNSYIKLTKRNNLYSNYNNDKIIDILSKKYLIEFK